MARPNAIKSYGLRAIEPSEAVTQASILQYLRHDHRVAWAERFNTGMHVIEGDRNTKRRMIKYAFKGCSDILGQMSDGRFLAIEVKSPTGSATREQRAFLDTVSHNGGVSVLARSIDDVIGAFET